MDKLSQLSKVSDAIKSTKELEKNYVSHLFTFMAMSQKLEETTKILDAVSKALGEINASDLEEVQKTKARIHRSVSMVRNEFSSQVNAMLKNPNYGQDLKDKLSKLLEDFNSIDQHTKPKGIFGGGKRIAARASKDRKDPKQPKAPRKKTTGGSSRVAKAYGE